MKSMKSVVAANHKRIFVVDDHPVVCEGLMLLFGRQSGFNVCGYTTNSEEAFSKILNEQPDIVIVDIILKGTNGVEFVQQLKTSMPALRILVFSSHEETLYAECAIRAGADGYITKFDNTNVILDALQRIVNDGMYLSSKMASELLGNMRNRNMKPDVSALSRLTDRELEVFRLLGEGLKPGLIAQRLNLSPKTIEAHRANIKKKLHVKSATDLARIAIRFVHHNLHTPSHFI